MGKKMKPVQSWLDEYAVSHQNPLNEKIHWVCVPLIMISIIGFLANIPLKIGLFSEYPQYNHAGLLLIIFGCIYYYYPTKIYNFFEDKPHY